MGKCKRKNYKRCEKKELSKFQKSSMLKLTKKIIITFFLLIGNREFLVRWKGCKPSEDTWEPEDNLDGSEELIETFMEKHEKLQEVSTKELRAAPKKVTKFNAGK